jgi:uncharacterized protein
VICYFDTSALVKLWIDEEGTGSARELWRQASLRLTAVLAYAECRAALASAVRARRIGRAASRTARTELDQHWRELAHVAVDEPIVLAAGDLAERERLRGYDAIHLACALAAADGGTLAFVTWDDMLRRAAGRHGLLTSTGTP